MMITTGKLRKPLKVVVYGPEGIGKSTFASQFPDPLFIDTEGSTNEMDVKRLPTPTSWQMLYEELQYVINNPGICKTLIIDTIDWAEQLCVEAICSKYGKTGIEDFGYGNGYVYTKEEFGRFLNKLTEVINAGIHVVLTAHAQIRKFEQPDEMGAFDRYELKLGKKTSSQTAPLVKEWSDMLLFANFKTIVVATDKEGKKNKAQGNKRVMYTSHHACWDAKNRHGLPEEVPFDFKVIESIVLENTPNVQPTANTVSEPAKKAPELDLYAPREDIYESSPVMLDDFTGIPKALSDLLVSSNLTLKDIQEEVGSIGYFPADMPVKDYPEDFKQFLVAQWENIKQSINKKRGN